MVAYPFVAYALVCLAGNPQSCSSADAAVTYLQFQVENVADCADVGAVLEGELRQFIAKSAISPEAGRSIGRFRYVHGCKEKSGG